MQRRASVQGSRSKRSKSVLRTGDSKERRRSSIYAISSDEGSNPDSSEQKLFENIHLQKEVIQSVKLQTWPIRKKLKLLRQAKNYVARHEGALQERLAMSRSTRDLWARFKILMESRWRHWSREVASFLTTLIPWESRIKEIESHFGSGVASYFTFLRWLLSVNIMIAIPLVAFVIGPEYFSTIKNETDPRKRMTEHEFQVAGRLFTIWEFEGYLKYSPMFYGYYSSYSGASRLGYKLPLAYFLTSVLVYVYSFVATLKKMAQNSRNSKLSSKDDECIFSWKLFTGWDFMIGHSETAHNRLASVIVGFKEALLEEAERKKDNQNWRIILQRILVNILVTVLLAASGATVVKLVNESGKLAMQDNWLSRNAVNVTMTLLSFFLPMIFEALGFIEKWHPRQQLRLQLARIMMLNMLNLYSLMFSFIYNITSKEKPLQELKILNETATLEYEQLKNIIESIKSGATDIQLDFITMATNFWTDNSSFLGNDLLTTPATTSSTVSLTTAATLLGFLNYSKVINFVNGNASNQTKTTPTTLPTTTTLAPTTTTRFTTSESNLLTSFLPLLTTTIQPDFTTWEEGSSGTDFLTTTTTAQTTIDSYEDSTNISTDYWDYTDGDTTTSRAITIKDRIPPKLSNNVSYFYFHDYFAGFPLQDDQTLDFYEEQLETSTIHNNNRNDSNNNNNKNDDDDEDDEDEKRGKRQIYEEALPTMRTMGTTTTTASPIIPIIVPPFRTSIYSRRKHSNLTTFSPLLLGLGFATTDPETQITTTTTTVPTTTTTTTTEIITTTTTTTPETTTIMTTTTELTTEETTILPTTTTTTPAPTTTTTIITTTSTTAPICRNETSTVAYKPKSTAVPLTPLQRYERRLIIVQKTLKEIQINLTSMCWETSLGQELSKVIVFDGVMGILVPLCIDLLRAVIVRYGNRNFCWDMEKTFPQYGDFKIAENILSLIYNQGQVWMGIFFSPGLVLINLVKLVIMMYFRSFIVLTCNVPHEVVFKASKSNNFYLTLLLTMLFLCVLPVGYAIVWLRPSWHCGPFSHYNRISEFITNTTRNALPKQLHEPLNYLTSSSTVIPLLLLLVLIIYYLVSLTGALREANQDLRTQLHKEREEERKKMFPVQESKQKMTVAALSSRWRKVLEVSSSANAQQRLAYEPGEYQFQSNKELLSRIVKNALRKGSATSEDDSTVYHVRGEDDTDNEHHDSLPADEEGKKKRLRLNKRKLRSERAIAEPTSPTSPTIDAEEHTRVLDERRQSLLRCKSQYEESTSATPAADITATNDFEVVDEKKPNRPLANVKNNSKEKGLFKSSLFKKSNASKSAGQPEKTEVSTVATMQNLTADHMNQFRTFSRASFKKFSTFMSLVRETVHANKVANEAAQLEEAACSKIVKTTDPPESSIEKSENVVKTKEEPEEVTSVQICVENSETVVGSEGDLVMKRNKILKSTSSNQIPTIMISMDSDDDMLYMHDIPSTTSGTQPVADGSANEPEIEEPRTADFIESSRASETN